MGPHTYASDLETYAKKLDTYLFVESTRIWKLYKLKFFNIGTTSKQTNVLIHWRLQIRNKQT